MWFKSVGLVLCILLGVATEQPTKGQELACDVQIDRSQLSGSEFSFLGDLRRRVEEYINERNWTEDQFLSSEQITCSMQIVFLEALRPTEFRTRLIVTSRRPIYGTSQSTVVVRINDSEWQFEYSRGTSLRYDPNRYNPLTSVLDFYANIILGYDYDTFSELGGTPQFESARRIANEAKGTGDPGWSATSSDRNRRQLIDELLAKRHQPVRRAHYRYHRKGLDRFVKDPENARTEVIGLLESLQETSQYLSNSYSLDLFFATKYQELTALFLGGEQSNRAYNLLTQIDPGHSSEYNKLMNR
ncbi:MAG: DUF4835 domain-containing protein [Bacteroidetes bacterium QH_7_62_13]|nr:MAG: DUF4835 domain-containing protein [Bacteroidetes bacterium QH_7_62_13]